MKKGYKILSIIIAVFMILGTISFNNFSFADDEVDINLNNASEVLLRELAEGNELEELDKETDENDELEESEAFKKPRNPKTPKEPRKPKGKIKIHKRIKRLDGSIDANFGSDTFDVQLTGPNGYNKILTIDKINGTGDHVTFKGLSEGVYTLTEPNLDNNMFSGFYVAEPGNNGADVGTVIDLGKGDNKNLWLINIEKESEPDPELPTGGKITVKKEIEGREEGESLAGFTFKLSNGEELTTGESGEVVFDNLPEGNYQVEEINIPAGYEYVSGEKNIRIKKTKKHLHDIWYWIWSSKTLTIINKKSKNPKDDGEIVVGKNVLSGDKTQTFEFILTHPDGTEERFKLGDGHKESFKDLPYGEYTLEENLPDGYTNDMDSNPLTFTITEEEKKWDFEVNNSKETEWEGEIRVYKYVQGEEVFEETFEFELEDEEGNIIGPFSTDEYGQVNFTGLEAGTYELRELPKEGYTQVSPEGSTFITIGPDIEGGDGNVWFAEFTNKKTPPRPKGSITIIKTFSDGRNPEGVQFILEGFAEMTATTNAAGEAKFENLPEGTYTLYEVGVDGYSSSISGGVEVVISSKTLDDMIPTIEVVNTKIPDEPNYGEIEVNKIVRDFNGTTIFDNNVFTFRLDKMIEGVWVEQAIKTIVGNGTVKFIGLADGEYRVRETNLPLGYTLVSSNNVIVTLYEEYEQYSDSVVFINQKDRIPVTDPDPTPDPEPDPELEPDPRIPEMRPEPTPEPELPTTPPEIPEEVIIVEPVPEAQPEPEPEVDSEETVKEEEEVVEEPVPEAKPVATLPKTGAASPLMATGLGTLLLAAGLFLRRKRR